MYDNVDDAVDVDDDGGSDDDGGGGDTGDFDDEDEDDGDDDDHNVGDDGADDDDDKYNGGDVADYYDGMMMMMMMCEPVQSKCTQTFQNSLCGNLLEKCCMPIPRHRVVRACAIDNSDFVRHRFVSEV